MPPMLGIMLGIQCMLLVACSIGSLITLYPALHFTLKVADSLYLLWLSWKIATVVYEKLDPDTTPPRPVPFYQGGLLQFLNRAKRLRQRLQLFLGSQPAQLRFRQRRFQFPFPLQAVARCHSNDE